jgi:DNA-binding transcriptional regulator LsrR (DeoR family)
VRSIPLRIAAAGGPSKTAILRAALVGGFADVLVTDETTAGTLLMAETGGES